MMVKIKGKWLPKKFSRNCDEEGVRNHPTKTGGSKMSKEHVKQGEIVIVTSGEIMHRVTLAVGTARKDFYVEDAQATFEEAFPERIYSADMLSITEGWEDFMGKYIDYKTYHEMHE